MTTMIALHTRLRRAPDLHRTIMVAPIKVSEQATITAASPRWLLRRTNGAALPLTATAHTRVRVQHPRSTATPTSMTTAHTQVAVVVAAVLFRRGPARRPTRIAPLRRLALQLSSRTSHQAGSATVARPLHPHLAQVRTAAQSNPSTRWQKLPLLFKLGAKGAR